MREWEIIAISNPASCKMIGSLTSHCGEGTQGVQNLQGLSSEIHTNLANGINFTVRCVNVCACISVVSFVF